MLILQHHFAATLQCWTLKQLIDIGNYQISGKIRNFWTHNPTCVWMYVCVYLYFLGICTHDLC